MPTVPPIECLRVEHDDVSIYYQVCGSGKPVILIHGLAGSARWWAPTVDALAREFRVYAVDLVQFGATSSRRPFVLEEAARFLTLWMDRIGVKRASVVGHSMGGLIAADLAADFSERVERLVLVDASIFPSNVGHTRTLLGLVRATTRMPVRFWPVIVADAYRAGPVTLWNAALQVLTMDVRGKLNRIRAPTLVIWGEHDHVVPTSIGRELTAYLPCAEFVVVEGAGHNPMWDRPDQFNQIVANFVRAETFTPSGQP